MRPGGGWYCVFWSQNPPIPLTVAKHCWQVVKPRFVPPLPLAL
jgi:hypothetical protein